MVDETYGGIWPFKYPQSVALNVKCRTEESFCQTRPNKGSQNVIQTEPELIRFFRNRKF